MFHRILSSIKLSHCITKTIYSYKEDNVIIIKETLQQDEDTTCTGYYMESQSCL